MKIFSENNLKWYIRASTLFGALAALHLDAEFL
jgi:hypothetical protein